MRFRRSPAPPPYLNRRDQWRLLSLVALFAIVLIAMRWASRPSSWYWLTGPPRQNAPPNASPQSFPSDAAVELGPLAPKAAARPADPSPSAGALRPSAATTSGDTRPEVQHTAGRPPGDRGGSSVSPGPAKPAPFGRGAGQVDPAVTVDPKVLSGVSDNTIGIRRSEKQAYELLLARARDLPRAELERAVRAGADYTVLMLEPESFRGSVVQVAGDLRRLLKFRAADNSYGLTDLYEAWVFTRESGSRPYRIVCSRIAEGIPEGMSLDPPIRVHATGYFFKLFSYATPDGRIQAAPLILAGELHREATAPASPYDRRVAWWFGGGFIALAAILALVAWRHISGDQQFRNQHLRRLTEPPPDAAAIANLELEDPLAHLRELGEAEDPPRESGETPKDSRGDSGRGFGD
ncbi:MAG: hypothetical protein GXP27_03620 [Planctomycetes bacterium]|nr:hypothetical protein [Planctomycetota bacterium]